MFRPAASIATTITRSQRRQSIVAAYVNAALWGLGSGLASTTLIVFLARRRGASGLAISWILAAPSLAGLMRLATPAWLARVASRRRFCVTMFLASAVVLATLPLLAGPGVLASQRAAIVALGATWAGYQLLEYIAVVALWSWLGELVPTPVRGRFLGRREACLNGGAVVGSVLAVAITMLGETLSPRFGERDLLWQAYAACDLAGAVALAFAAVALLQVIDVVRQPHVAPASQFQWRHLWTPFVDSRYRPFMTFGLWFSASNGIIQTAQSLYPIGPLGFSFGAKKALDGALRAGKTALLPRLGTEVDRRGNVPVLTACQALIALAPLFFLYASPAAPWWILGVYVCWLAYAGHDVTLTNLMLGLSESDDRAAFAAGWFAWTQLAFSLSTLAGGALFDWLSDHFEPASLGGRPIDHYFLLFVGSWLLKSFGIRLAPRISEPISNR